VKERIVDCINIHMNAGMKRFLSRYYMVESDHTHAPIWLAALAVLHQQKRTPAQLRLNFGSIHFRLAPPLHTLCSVSLSLAQSLSASLSLAQPLLNLGSGCSCSAQLSSGSGFWDLPASWIAMARSSVGSDQMCQVYPTISGSQFWDLKGSQDSGPVRKNSSFRLPPMMFGVS
jgi:hypothetical protein